MDLDCQITGLHIRQSWRHARHTVARAVFPRPSRHYREVNRPSIITSMDMTSHLRLIPIWDWVGPYLGRNKGCVLPVGKVWLISRWTLRRRRSGSRWGIACSFDSVAWRILVYINFLFYLFLLVWIPDLDILISVALCNGVLVFSSYLCTLLGLIIAWHLNWDCIAYHIILALNELIGLLPL